jgi:queuine tRNA-ribosyltransferase
MKFALDKTEKSIIRQGEIETSHGVILTPFFMPVGTVGSVKGMAPWELEDLGAQVILSNTYHLHLRPGEKLIKKLGGLHKFIGWNKPILTDSGGYQVFSFGKKLENNQDTRDKKQINPKSEVRNPIQIPDRNDQNFNKPEKLKASKAKSLVRISSDGVEFRSHIDGSKHFFTPEKVIDIQLDLGVDILMPLDVCPAGNANRKEIEKAVKLTIEWAKRSKRHFDKVINKSKLKSNNYNLKVANLKKLKSYDLQPEPPGLFAIVQGGLDLKLREECAKELIKLGMDGYAVGGLAVDYETRDMWSVVECMGKILPVDKPRYLMGVGTPDDIIQAVGLGMDMFDCVLPTRMGRHGCVFTRKINNSKLKSNNYNQKISNKLRSYKLQAGSYQLVNLLKSQYRTDSKVIEPGCGCPACKSGFSKAHISHLIRENEMLGLRLATMHNLFVYLGLVRNLRQNSFC